MAMRSSCSAANLLAAIAVAVALAALAGPVAHAADYIAIPSGQIASVLASDAYPSPSKLASFAMRVTPVSNGEFLAFVQRSPQWQRGRASSVLADRSYLQHWRAPLQLGNVSLPEQPLTSVSWFAAQAFCESEGARLPTWLEWEYVAAADATRRDARSSAEWRAQILAWYALPSTTPLAGVGGNANVYGVRDLHGLIWEWVDDFNSLLVSADSRNQGDPDKLQFCGAGAISLKDRDNYAVLMRIALLSSLSAADTTRNLGFRCVRPDSGETK